MAGRRSPEKRRAFRLKLARNLVLVLAATELLLRLVLGNFAQSRLLRHSEVPDICLETTPDLDLSYTGWLLRTGATRMRTNSLGGRGGEVQPKPPGALRVVHIGDSFAFGQGVEEEESFAAVSTRELSMERLTVDTLNFGVPGHGTPQSIALLEHKLLPLDPDVVLLHVFANDLTAEDSYCLRGPRQGKRKAERWLLQNVYSARVLAILSSPFRQIPSPENLAELGTPEDRYIAAIARGAELARAGDFLFAVVLLTDRDMFTESRYCRGCAAPHDLMDGLDAHVIDLSSTWERLQEDKGTNYIFGEGHFSVEGSLVVGTAIAEQLRVWPAFAKRAAAP
ncbi:MAG: SGNH/GDSL hydrolase family protein [Deltaproteobacteria bacterium]|nr:SGNH/GDSL hydrolase family protein [Deltaproteobacteria bacterium]